MSFFQDIPVAISERQQKNLVWTLRSAAQTQDDEVSFLPDKRVFNRVKSIHYESQPEKALNRKFQPSGKVLERE